MEICSNCLRRISRDHFFCPFCGFPATRVGFKKCAEGHIMVETWKTCPFCARIENLGKSLIDIERREPREPREPHEPHEHLAGMSTEVLGAVNKSGIPDDRTVLESDTDDRTKLETMTGMTLDKTVLESDTEKTILDEALEPPLFLPFFAWLVFLGEEGKPTHDIRLTRQKSVIGKGADADIRLNDDFASKLHAVIHFEEGRFFISDLGSTNHTWLNEKKIIKEELKDGDFLRIGHQKMIFKHVRRKL